MIKQIITSSLYSTTKPILKSNPLIVSSEIIHLYSKASGDCNPLHLD